MAEEFGRGLRQLWLKYVSTNASNEKRWYHGACVAGPSAAGAGAAGLGAGGGGEGAGPGGFVSGPGAGGAVALASGDAGTGGAADVAGSAELGVETVESGGSFVADAVFDAVTSRSKHAPTMPIRCFIRGPFASFVKERNGLANLAVKAVLTLSSKLCRFLPHERQIVPPWAIFTRLGPMVPIGRTWSAAPSAIASMGIP